MKPKNISELNKERLKRILNNESTAHLKRILNNEFAEEIECKNIKDITTEEKKKLLEALFNATDIDETVQDILDMVDTYGEALCGDPDISLSVGMNRVTGACEILGTLVPRMREDLLKVLARAASNFACSK